MPWVPHNLAAEPKALPVREVLVAVPAKQERAMVSFEALEF